MNISVICSDPGKPGAIFYINGKSAFETIPWKHTMLLMHSSYVRGHWEDHPEKSLSEIFEEVIGVRFCEALQALSEFLKDDETGLREQAWNQLIEHV